MTALNESDLAVSDPNMAASPDLQRSLSRYIQVTSRK